MPRVTMEPIDLAALTALVARSDRGAVTSFVGLVRNHHQGRTVTSLAYSAYDVMAELSCEQIVREGEARWNVSIALQHRIGELAIGDIAVAAVVAGGHRGESFEACRWVIEEVKSRVPIWKRERYDDGSEAWVDPTAIGGVVPVKHS